MIDQRVKKTVTNESRKEVRVKVSQEAITFRKSAYLVMKVNMYTEDDWADPVEKGCSQC